ncbi:MAG: DUF1580 domain-containing protein [Isosphaeraceae bacterium]
MIDISVENPISLRHILTQFPEKFPGRHGTPISQCTLENWANHGVRGVRLETVLVGGRRATSIEAVGRFYEGIAEVRQTEGWRAKQGVIKTQRTAKARAKANAAALRKLGMKPVEAAGA